MATRRIQVHQRDGRWRLERAFAAASDGDSFDLHGNGLRSARATAAAILAEGADATLVDNLGTINALIEGVALGGPNWRSDATGAKWSAMVIIDRSIGRIA